MGVKEEMSSKTAQVDLDLARRALDQANATGRIAVIRDAPKKDESEEAKRKRRKRNALRALIPTLGIGAANNLYISALTKSKDDESLLHLGNMLTAATRYGYNDEVIPFVNTGSYGYIPGSVGRHIRRIDGSTYRDGAITYHDNMNPGLIAHEIGHATSPVRDYLPLSAAAAKIAPLVGTTHALVTSDAKKARRSALIAGAVSVPSFLEELRASYVGSKIMRDVGNTSLKERLTPFAGIPTYAVVGSLPYLSYRLKKRFGGYREEEKRDKDEGSKKEASSEAVKQLPDKTKMRRRQLIADARDVGLWSARNNIKGKKTEKRGHDIMDSDGILVRFYDRCVSEGIDPVELLKTAQSADSPEVDSAARAAGRIARIPGFVGGMSLWRKYTGKGIPIGFKVNKLVPGDKIVPWFRRISDDGIKRIKSPAKLTKFRDAGGSIAGLGGMIAAEFGADKLTRAVARWYANQEFKSNPGKFVMEKQQQAKSIPTPAARTNFKPMQDGQSRTKDMFSNVARKTVQGVRNAARAYGARSPVKPARASSIAGPATENLRNILKDMPRPSARW